MAFNWQTFRTRALTAIVFVAVMAAGLFISRWAFLALFTLVHFGGWYEFLKLRKAAPGHTPSTTLTDILAGIVYITLPLFLLCDLRFNWLGTRENSGDAGLDDITNLSLVLLLIFSIWINDTMAYIVGSLIGRTPLSKISPKKTWEGTAGGAVLAVLVMAGIAWLVDPKLALHAGVIAAIAGVTGTIGDLFESKLKRTAGVKDSGSFMPGHGGFLDRFDSLLFAAPCVWLYAAVVY